MTSSFGSPMAGEHLHPKALPLLELTKEERIDHIRRHPWIGYPRAREALEKLEELIGHPGSHRMPNLMMYGPTNNGKTMIVQRFLRDHPADDNVSGDAVSFPVLHVQMPFAPDPRRFYIAILEQLFATYRPTDTIARLEALAVGLMRTCGVKIVIIDELHNIVGARVDKQRQFLNLLRYLGNELCVPIVGVGLKSGLRAIQIDEQLANRFEPFPLPLWSDGPDLRRLLTSMEAILPLNERSYLAEDRMAETILAMTDGTIGEITTLVRRAAIRAIETGGETIDRPLLNVCGYLPPSERRRAAERAG